MPVMLFYQCRLCMWERKFGLLLRVPVARLAATRPPHGAVVVV